MLEVAVGVFVWAAGGLPRYAELIARVRWAPTTGNYH
jgi:hypothetical protein